MKTDNELIADFMKFRKSSYQYLGRYINKSVGYEKLTDECFTLPESHPLVENIYTDRPGFTWHDPYRHEDLGGNERELVFDFEELKFHLSWDWLMPVVEKIEYLGHGITIYRKGAHINEVGNFSGSINGFNHSSKIEQTYKAVVQFINWYNKHQ